MKFLLALPEEQNCSCNGTEQSRLLTFGEIKKGLKKYYNKDLTERHILNVINDLGTVVIKEKDPRNHRKPSLQNKPNFVKEATLVKLNNKKA